MVFLGKIRPIKFSPLNHFNHTYMTQTHANTPKKHVQWLLITVLFLVTIFVLWPVLRELGYRSGDNAVALRVYEWRDELKLEALEQEYKLPKGLLSAVMHQESAGDPQAQSHAGAKGLFQFMLPTAKDMGLDDRTHPQGSAIAAAKYLSQLYVRYDKNLELTLAAYNWGLGNIDQYVKPKKGETESNYAKFRLNKMPNETQDYIARIKMLRTTYYLR